MNNIFEFHKELNIKKVIGLIALFVLIILLIVFFYPENTEKKLKKQEATNPYKTYASLDNRVSLELPKRYNLQPVESNYILQLQANEGLLINIEEEPLVFGKSLKEISTSDKDVYTKKFENSFDISDLKEFSLENNNALSSYTYNFKYIQEETTYSIQIYWIQGNTCYYVISTSFPESTTNTYHGLESEIIASFKMN